MSLSATPRIATPVRGPSSTLLNSRPSTTARSLTTSSPSSISSTVSTELSSTSTLAAASVSTPDPGVPSFSSTNTDSDGIRQQGVGPDASTYNSGGPSVPLLICLGSLVGMFVIMTAFFAGKVYRRRKEMIAQKRSDLEKELFSDTNMKLDMNKMEPAHMRGRTSFEGQRHPAALSKKGDSSSFRARSPSLTIDTERANMLRSGIPIPQQQRKPLASRRSPLATTVETAEVEDEKSPEVKSTTPVDGGLHSRGTAGRSRSNSNNLKVEDAASSVSPTRANGKPEVDRKCPSPTNRRRAAVDQFIKDQNTTQKEEGNNISLVVSSFVNQNEEGNDTEKEESEDNPVNIRALADYDEREVISKSPQHSEGVNITDNANYSNWKEEEEEEEVEVATEEALEYEENDDSRRSSKDGSVNQKSATIKPIRLHYQGKRPKRIVMQLNSEGEEI